MYIKNFTTFMKDVSTFGMLFLKNYSIKDCVPPHETLKLNALFEKNFKKLANEIDEKEDKLSKKKC
jgi:hypothetical protein